VTMPIHSYRFDESRFAAPRFLLLLGCPLVLRECRRGRVRGLVAARASSGGAAEDIARSAPKSWKLLFWGYQDDGEANEAFGARNSAGLSGQVDHLAGPKYL